MIAQIKMRRGTTAEWAAASPVVLAAGEPGWDSTLEGMKVGDGSTEWAALPWIDAKNSLADILLAIYPIGAVYQSTVSTSPATLFGGTWAALGGRMLIGVDGTYTAGETGGAATHALGLGDGYAKMRLWAYTGDTIIDYQTKNVSAYTTASEVSFPVGPISVSQTIPGGIELGGSTSSGDTMPPYLSVYMWERTA